MDVRAKAVPHAHSWSCFGLASAAAFGILPTVGLISGQETAILRDQVVHHVLKLPQTRNAVQP